MKNCRSMLLRALCLTTAMLTSVFTLAAPVPPDAKGWKRILEGKMATVDVEEHLYEQDGEPAFFIAVRVTNRGAKPIGIDLRDSQYAIRPNQWGVYDKPQRDVLDERRASTPRLDAAAERALKADFGRGALTQIEPGKSIVYYHAFNGDRHPDRRLAKGKFVIVSLAGQTVATDGEAVMQLRFEDHDLGQLTDLVLPTPCPWARLPAGALVAPQKGS